MATNKKLWIFLSVVALLLLVSNIYNGYASNDYNYWSITSNSLILIVMIFNYVSAAKAAGKENQ